MSQLKVDSVRHTSATGDNITLASNQGLTFPGDVTFTTGKTITVPAGATITNSGTATGFGGGKILQFQGWTKTNTSSFTVDEGGESSIPMSQNITPTASTSKILVMYSISVGMSSGGVVAIRAKVNSTNAGGVGTGADTGDNKRYASANHYVPDADGRATINFQFVHSPNTTSVTNYAFSMLHWVGATRTMYINRSHNDANATATHRLASSITLLEIGA